MNKMHKTAQLSNFMAALTGAPLPMAGTMDWVNDLLNPEAIANNLIFIGALGQNIRNRYRPEAYYYALEMDDSRGYKNLDPSTGAKVLDPITGKPIEADKWQHSQGHLEYLDYDKIQRDLNSIPTTGSHGETADRQFSELHPPSDMPMFVKRNINISEDSPEYKKMFKKLYPGVPVPPPTTASNNKFIKVSQVEDGMEPISREAKIEDLKKKIPKWDFKTLLTELDLVVNSAASQAKNSGVSLDNPQVKKSLQTQFQNVLKKYQEDIKPLHNYLAENGYGQKTN